MSVKEFKVNPDAPLSEWPVYYKDGLPFIYDDDHLFVNEDGELMGQHERHSNLAFYLSRLLRWHYRDELCSVTYEVTFQIQLKQSASGSSRRGQKTYIEVTPDVAFIKGVRHDGSATYHIGPDKPAPVVVFEIASPATYKEDLGEKFRLYAEVCGVHEYIVYDPQDKRLWPGLRFKAWRLEDGQYIEIERDERGWVWSEELQSWLVEDGPNLWLYDKDGNKRLNQAEEAEFLVALERQQVLEEKRRATQEKRRATMEKKRADQAEVRAEQERQRAEQLEARLRELEAQMQRAKDGPENRDT